jgi:hypothetical protein
VKWEKIIRKRWEDWEHNSTVKCCLPSILKALGSIPNTSPKKMKH